MTRNGCDFTMRYPKIVAAVANVPIDGSLMDGEAIVVDEFGLSNFNAHRYRPRDAAAILCAFGLVERDGKDLHWQPLEHRKATLADLPQGVGDGIALRHFSGDGARGAPAVKREAEEDWGVFLRAVQAKPVTLICRTRPASHVIAGACRYRRRDP